MKENMQAWQDALEVAIKIIEEGKSLANVAKTILEKSDLVTKVGAYLRTIADISIGRTGAANFTKQYRPTTLNKIAICSNFPKEEEENMKNIRHRKDGRWEFRLQKDNKRYSIIGRTRTELLNKVKIFKKSIKTEAVLSPTRGNQKLIDFAKYWFKTFKSPSIEDKTRKMYDDALKNVEKLDKNIQDISATQLQEFLNEFPPTRTKEILFMTLKQIFSKAYELKTIKEDISMHLVKGKIEKSTRDFIDYSDQKKLINYLQGKNDSFSMALYVYLLVGCRPLEINRIRKKDIGNDLIYVDGTKNKNAKRLVRISCKFSEMLKAYAKDLKPNEHLFKFSYDSISSLFEDLRDKLKIDASLYCLRHTYSTNLYYLGASDKERQQSMGHATAALTNDVYTHIDFNMNKKNLKKLYGNLYPEYTDR